MLVKWEKKLKHKVKHCIDEEKKNQKHKHEMKFSPHKHNKKKTLESKKK